MTVQDDNTNRFEAVHRAQGTGDDATESFGHDSDLSFVPFSADLSQAELDAIAALPHASALLIARSGPMSGARYLLNTDVTTVGRHPEADVFFDDVTVSRRHAQIVRDGVDFEIIDQKSLNGIFVNGERVDRAALTNGSEIRVGKFRLIFLISPEDLPDGRNH